MAENATALADRIDRFATRLPDAVHQVLVEQHERRT